MRFIDRTFNTNSAALMFLADAIQHEQFRLSANGTLDNDTARWSEELLRQTLGSLTPDEQTHYHEQFAGRNVFP